MSAPALSSTNGVVSVEIDGVVDPIEASFISSQIRTANVEKANAVVIRIDTPGGLDTSMRKIVGSILESKVPVLCLVSPSGARAASAGTFILLACHVSAMAPGTAVGAAHPVGISGLASREKVVNDSVAFIRSIAQERERDADWAERAVRESVSVSADEALRLGLIDFKVRSTSELLEATAGMSLRVGGRDVVITSSPRETSQSLGFGPNLLHRALTPDFAFAFFYLGLILLAVELLHPGVSVPGVLGVSLLAMSLLAFGMLPVRLSGLTLLAVSVAFFIVEVKHPGLGLPAVGGVVSLVLGGLLLFDRSVGEGVSLSVIIPVALGVAAFSTLVVKAAMKVRRRPPSMSVEKLIGLVGEARSDLDPRGSIQVAGESWSAKASHGSIP
ncbi:MAG TPA: nodulation protein NfeD, partial [Actinomycetota bacterium]|nr:nodulation protein NfeD [Actinomycetota bacterium]